MLQIGGALRPLTERVAGTNCNSERLRRSVPLIASLNVSDASEQEAQHANGQPVMVM